MTLAALIALALGPAPQAAPDMEGHAGTHAGSHQHPAPAASPVMPPTMPSAAMSGDEATNPDQPGNAAAPKPPTDHAADSLFDPAAMARARSALRHEHGAMNSAMLLIDKAEYQARKGRDGYHWEGEAWSGGDLTRATVKFRGEGAWRGRVHDAEFQLLASRAIAPYWNLQAGARIDVRPHPARAYLALGVEGLAPWWFHVTGALFVSTHGNVRARLEASHDMRITQRLVLQPRAEVNLSSSNVPRLKLGSGLSAFEGGARLRYEFSPRFAPYVGVEWVTMAGHTARYAHRAGERRRATQFMIGWRGWF